MLKTDALITLMREARSERSSQAALNRSVRACEALQLSIPETVLILGWLDLCDAEGHAYRKLEMPSKYMS